jgi:hypothetical protein
VVELVSTTPDNARVPKQYTATMAAAAKKRVTNFWRVFVICITFHDVLRLRRRSGEFVWAPTSCDAQRFAKNETIG